MPEDRRVDPDETRFSPPEGARVDSVDPNETRFVPPQGTSTDPDATRFVSTEPPLADDEATRFVDPVADHLVDPEVTRLEVTPAHPAVSADPDETRFVEPSSARPPGPRTPQPVRPSTRASGAGRIGARTKDGDTGPLDVGQAFSNRYHIIRVLGIGGMGAVYHAWDAELGMAVALKVIRPEATADPAAAREMERRFKQELVLARQVTHKNVVRIHDLGEIDGIKYITMPYLEGSDLSTVLKNTGKMTVPDALRIVRDVASGLMAAHEAGIVHRDLKPANIMVLKDRAVIMDFGIARSSKLPSESSPNVAPSAALDSLKSMPAATMAGTILGTVQYMAPEQAKGLDVDQRADVYALGLIFLDMLLGKRHTHATSAIEELKLRIEQPPPLAQTIDPTIPKSIEQVIAKCLQPDREQRYQTSAELVAALDRLDEKGELIPVRRTIRLPYAIAGVVLLLAISVGVWWYQRQFIPPTKHETVKVVIADFQNSTNDPAFDRTLEPMLKRALEGAGFVIAFDRDGITRTLGVQPPERLDEAAARTLAAKQGVGVVLAGMIEREGQGYRVSLKAVQALTGEVIRSDQSRVASKDQVIDTTTRLVTRVRSALGDEASESTQMFAMATLSTTSLEVLRYWVAGREAAANRKYDEALRNYEKAVQLDPKFGLGYQGLANVYANVSNQAEARKHVTEAMSHVASMTDRERMTTRGGFYRLTGDYPQCVKEYSELLTTYPADVAAHNNLAICYFNLRNFSKAFEEMQQVVAIVPNRTAYRANLANIADFNSDFVTAEREARKITEPDAITLIVLAFSQLGQGQFARAMDTYQKATSMGSYPASLATSGLADLANVQGHFSEAAKLLEQGIVQDLASKRPDLAAAKLAALARTQFALGQARLAVATAEKALMNDDGLNIRFMAARTFIEAGRLDKANPLIAAMSKQLLTEPRAYAKILEGEIALKNRDLLAAIERFTEANTLLDTWLGRFDLGRAYFEAGQFPQADSEFERCVKRRGEALQLVLNDEPTYAFLPPVYYYQGRVRQGLKSEGAVDSYREYLKFRGESTEDPLVKDIKKRIGG